MKKQYPFYTVKYEIHRPWWLLFLVQMERYLIQITCEYWDDPTCGNGGGSWEVGTFTVARYYNFDKARAALDKYKVLNMPNQERRWHPTYENC